VNLSTRFIALLVVTVLVGIGMNSAVASADTPETTWDHVNVALVDSTVYHDVSLAWKLEGYSLEITKSDGERINVGPMAVTKITDRNGLDITNDVADLSPATNAKFALLGDKKTIPFQFKAMFLAGVSGVLTNTDDSHKPLGAVLVATRIALDERAHFSLFYRRQQVAESISAGGGSFSTNAHEIHLLLGLRTTHPRRNNNYGYMEAGVALINFDQRYDNNSNSWVSNNSNEVGLTLQGGVVIPFSENFAVDLSGILEYRPSLVIDGGESGIMVGLNVALVNF